MAKHFANRFAASLVLCAGLFLSAGTASAAGPELVVNGGFETGHFDGWTTTPSSGVSVFDVDAGDPKIGNYSAYFGALDPYDVISQSLATTIGTKYTVSFYLGSEFDSQDAGFIGSIDGISFVSLSGGAAFAFSKQSYDFTATSTSSLLSFAAYNADALYSLDEVSVTPVPEPSTYALMSLGIVGIAALARRRQSAKAAQQ